MRSNGNGLYGVFRRAITKGESPTLHINDICNKKLHDLLRRSKKTPQNFRDRNDTVYNHLIATTDAMFDSIKKKDHISGNKKAELCLLAFLHDIGKPSAYKIVKGRRRPTFYKHNIIGANIVRDLFSPCEVSGGFLKRLCNDIRHHMFFYNDRYSDLSFKRLINKLGINKNESVDDIMGKNLILLRIAERVGRNKTPLTKYDKKMIERIASLRCV